MLKEQKDELPSFTFTMDLRDLIPIEDPVGFLQEWLEYIRNKDMHDAIQKADSLMYKRPIIYRQ